MRSDPLFSELDGYSVLEGQKQQLKAAIASAPETMFSRPDDDVILEYVAKYELDVPTLLENEMTMSEREVDVDVSHEPRRVFVERHRAFYIKGTEVTVHIPFKGEAVLFRVRPNFWSSSMPRGTVHGRELRIQFTFTNDSSPPDLKGELQRSVSQINQFLGRLRGMANQLHDELIPIARQTWQQRKAQFSSKSQVFAGLGIPKRSEVNLRNPETSIENTARIGTKSRIKPAGTSWDVFISHASEDKELFVKPLAEALTTKGIRVWYDEYTLTIGDSLRGKIDEGLAKSRFGIVVLSPAFFSKHWPQQELNGLAAREVSGIKVILPIWHNMTYQDVTSYSPMLADRLAVKSNEDINHVVDQLARVIKP